MDDDMTRDPLSPPEEAFVKTVMALAGGLDVQETCAAVLDVAEQMFEARSSWVLLHDGEADKLVAVLYRGPDGDSYGGARVPVSSQTVSAIAFRDRQPLFVPDVHEEERWHDASRVHGANLSTVLTVPLVYQDSAVGVLGLDSSRFSSDAPPTAGDVARLQAIAAQAAIGIRNAWRYADVERDRDRLRRLLGRRRPWRGGADAPRRLRDDVPRAGLLVGTSPALRAALDQVELVAPANTTVLLVGETGTGKELVARTIHEASGRRGQPLVSVNCAAIPESLIESELFGYEKGAFTGAVARTPGKFELADRGTILLDEVGDLPAPAQAKLLRVLQEREVQRVGATRPVSIDVRVIAATNRDLDECLETGAFRADLFYRLSVFPIRLPPLRERRDDIPMLAMHFAEVFSHQQHKAPPQFAPGVLDQLAGYAWPGNIRELQNVIERAVILANGECLTGELIAPRAAAAIEAATPVAVAPAARSTEPRPATVIPFLEAERRAILRALELTGWRISGEGGAAEVLGLKATTLHAKMKKLGIRRPMLARAVAAERA
jgi:transcriptional regulator with GAF, ATPase, and Fis domain